MKKHPRIKNVKMCNKKKSAKNDAKKKEKKTGLITRLKNWS
jgi:hypothetical protein